MFFNSYTPHTLRRSALAFCRNLFVGSTALFAFIAEAGTFVPVSRPQDLPQALWQALSAGNIAAMVNALFIIAIGIGALLAVVMIVIAGIQFMGSDSYSSRGAAKERFAGAIIGLLILLGSWLILNTISPTLVTGLFP